MSTRTLLSIQLRLFLTTRTTPRKRVGTPSDINWVVLEEGVEPSWSRSSAGF